jgi:hypothetical protein
VRSAKQEPSQQIGAVPIRHVGLDEPSPCLLHREQAPVETVLHDATEMGTIDVGCDVDHRSQSSRSADAVHGSDVLLRNAFVVDDHLLPAEQPMLGQRAVAVTSHSPLQRGEPVIARLSYPGVNEDLELALQMAIVGDLY